MQPRWSAMTLAALLALTLGGCAEPQKDAVTAPSSDQAPDLRTAETASPASQDAPGWNSTGRIRLATSHWHVGTTAFDVMCLMGGEWYYTRTEGGMVLPGTAAIELDVHAGPTWTGRQVGVRIDGGEIQWLPTVGTNERKVFSVPVTPDQWETDGQRWEFWYRDTIPGGQDLCYTGASIGEGDAVIDAVRG